MNRKLFNHLSDEEAAALHLENEIMKIKLQAEMGAEIHLEENLPPDLEAELLSHVYEFEQAWKEVKLKPLYTILGEPPYLPPDELNENEIMLEVERLLELFEARNMHIDIPEDISTRRVYEYITEYLFDQEIDDLQLEGMQRYFIFNEGFDEDETKA